MKSAILFESLVLEKKSMILSVCMCVCILCSLPPKLTSLKVQILYIEPILLIVI